MNDTAINTDILFNIMSYMPNNEKNKILLLCKESNNDLKNVYDRCRSNVLSKKIFNIWTNEITVVIPDDDKGVHTIYIYKNPIIRDYKTIDKVRIEYYKLAGVDNKNISVYYGDGLYRNVIYTMSYITHKDNFKYVKRSLFYYYHHITHFKKSFKESLKISKYNDKRMKEEEEKAEIEKEEREKKHLIERLKYQQRIANLIYGF